MENRTKWSNIHVIGTPKGEGKQRMASDTVKAIHYFLLWMKVKVSNRIHFVKESHAYLCKKLLEKKDRFPMKEGQFNRERDSHQ